VFPGEAKTGKPPLIITAQIENIKNIDARLKINIFDLFNLSFNENLLFNFLWEPLIIRKSSFLPSPEFILLRNHLQ
jgi:hypothetical protein